MRRKSFRRPWIGKADHPTRRVRRGKEVIMARVWRDVRSEPGLDEDRVAERRRELDERVRALGLRQVPEAQPMNQEGRRQSDARLAVACGSTQPLRLCS